MELGVLQLVLTHVLAARAGHWALKSIADRRENGASTAPSSGLTSNKKRPGNTSGRVKQSQRAGGARSSASTAPSTRKPSAASRRGYHSKAASATAASAAAAAAVAAAASTLPTSQTLAVPSPHQGPSGQSPAASSLSAPSDAEPSAPPPRALVPVTWLSDVVCPPTATRRLWAAHDPAPGPGPHRPPRSGTGPWSHPLYGPPGARRQVASSDWEDSPSDEHTASSSHPAAPFLRAFWQRQRGAPSGCQPSTAAAGSGTTSTSGSVTTASSSEDGGGSGGVAASLASDFVADAGSGGRRRQRNSGSGSGVGWLTSRLRHLERFRSRPERQRTQQQQQQLQEGWRVASLAGWRLPYECPAGLASSSEEDSGSGGGNGGAAGAGRAPISTQQQRQQQQRPPGAMQLAPFAGIEALAAGMATAAGRLFTRGGADGGSGRESDPAASAAADGGSGVGATRLGGYPPPTPTTTTPHFVGSHALGAAARRGGGSSGLLLLGGDPAVPGGGMGGLGAPGGGGGMGALGSAASDALGDLAERAVEAPVRGLRNLNRAVTAGVSDFLASDPGRRLSEQMAAEMSSGALMAPVYLTEELVKARLRSLLATHARHLIVFVAVRVSLASAALHCVKAAARRLVSKRGPRWLRATVHFLCDVVLPTGFFGPLLGVAAAVLQITGAGPFLLGGGGGGAAAAAATADAGPGAVDASSLAATLPAVAAAAAGAAVSAATETVATAATALAGGRP